LRFKSQSLSNAEIKGLQDEIDQLKIKLTQAKEDSKTGVSDEDLLRLQEQLQIAVAESVEMQAELEATKARLAQMEANGPYIEAAASVAEALE
jgi:uncharacterized protein YhaN